jgi:hypothetical protein
MGIICMKRIFFLLFFLLLRINALYADSLVPAVPLFPERTLYLPKVNNKVHHALNDYIVHDFKADGLKLSVGTLKNTTDYQLFLEYAIGCPALGESEQCRLLVLWDLLRGDNAPVASWQAYYPIDIPVSYHLSRFKDYIIPKAMIALIGDDFIKSLNYETLKNQTFDTVYIKPDRLNDGTTLCSNDSIQKFYETSGLYVSNTAYKARFLVDTLITPLKNTGDTVIMGIKRMILDRLTGQYQIFPIESAVEKDFLAKDSYDCNQSAGITIQDIGLFIDKAP